MVNVARNRLGTTAVPTPVKGRTIRALQRAMLRLNARVNGTVFYMGPPQWVQNEQAWIVWYYVEQTMEEQMQGALDGDN